jgi:hypothetical protein
LKDGRFELPKTYLCAKVEKNTLPNGQQCWSMLSEKYVKSALKIVNGLLEEDGHELKTGK